MLSRLMTVREQWILLGVAGAIVLGSVVLIWRGSRSPSPQADSFSVRTESTPTRDRVPNTSIRPPTPVLPVATMAPPPPERIAVGILGAVNREGLYYFDKGERIKDLLAAAGGARLESDLSDINRTALLIDETTLLVPELIFDGNQTYSYPDKPHNPAPYTRSTWYRFEKEARSTATPSSAAGATASSSTGLIDINTASQSQLETLPGIGPVTAQKIIAYRANQAFATPDDLENVSGIGPAKMAAVRSLITVGR